MILESKTIIAITGLVSTFIVFALVSLGRKRERAHLLNNGARTIGRVVSIKTESDRAGMKKIMRYQFTPEGQGKVVEGQCHASVLSSYKPGDTVVVCYNKSFPSSSIILSSKGRPI